MKRRLLGHWHLKKEACQQGECCWVARHAKEKCGNEEKAAVSLLLKKEAC